MTIYQHFRENEYPFINQVVSWKETVEKIYQHRLSDFLDPREQQIVKMIIGQENEDLQVVLSGGGKFTERKRLIIAPFYQEITEEDFQLTLIQATYNEKFITLSHRDVMGSFLSLGLKRPKLGDIIVENGKIQIIVAAEIAQYVIANLTKIKNANITWSEKSISSLLENEMKWIESDSTVSSLRLDAVMKEIYKISRNVATNHIIKKHVRVNFKLVDEKKFNLFEGDLISLRSKGRGKLVKINGRTKKNKIRITTAVLK